ncbi:tyrosine-protein kinase receptor ver-3-like [Anopheles stephensi]|uniref:tyrosine-protein kinase receptor ver-3-like n=1 Tax=Anopheles stephensi TaxID=30069 RepID=UPI0016589F25|nr:tyrosine-protein kinase receptor ver-3-like [Anopheles stephensi]
MHCANSSIQLLNHVLLVLCVVNYIQCSYDQKDVVRIFGPRLVPEHSELTLECEAVAEDLQNATINWFFSEIMTPISTNKYHSPTVGKSTLQINHVLRQQTNIYYCCLNDSTTICASQSVIVLYTTLDRQIMPINETSGVLILQTQSADGVPEQLVKFNFALCLRYRWKFENVDIVSLAGTDHHHNETVRKKIDRTLLWNHLYYNVEYNLRTESRLFQVQLSDSVSEAAYYLYVFLNGKPRPKMHDIAMLPDTGFIDLSCWGTAVPAPRVTFSFTPCPSQEWNNCNHPPVTLAESTSTRSSIAFNESTQVIGSTLSSGIVHCKATNSQGTSWTHAKLFQLHQYEAITLRVVHPSSVIYVGDTITAQCSVDRYNFTNRFTFRVLDLREEALGLQENFNWVANLTINNVTISQNRIVCESLHQNGTLISKTLALSIVQPYIEAQDRVRHLVAEPDTQLLLSCNVNGRPMPQYRWFQNGIELPHTNFMLIASVSGDDKFECIARNRVDELTITWLISSSGSNSGTGSIEFNSHCITAIVLLLIAIMGAVLCYFKAKQLCTLFRLLKAIRTRSRNY